MFIGDKITSSWSTYKLYKKVGQISRFEIIYRFVWNVSGHSTQTPVRMSLNEEVLPVSISELIRSESLLLLKRIFATKGLESALLVC